jgi:Trypsin-like peptidase domain
MKIMKPLRVSWVICCAVVAFVLAQKNVFADFPPDFLSYAVMIKMPIPNGESGGSGFYYQTGSNLFLVTARHVLFGRDPSSTNLISTNATLISYPAPESSDEKFEFDVDLDEARLAGNIRRHPVADVAVIKIATIVTSENNVYRMVLLPGVTRPAQATSGNYKGFLTNDVTLFSAASAGSDIVIIGLPRSLATAPMPIQLIDAEKPLLCHGIISGRNAQLRLLIVDATSFQGNSGGPVVQLVEIPNVFPIRSEYKLVGLVGGFVPHTEMWRDQYETSGAMINANSGYTYVIPIDAAMELLQ